MAVPAMLAVTVTAWAVLQFAVVKIRAPLTVTVPGSPDVGVTVTSPVGMVARTTV